MAMFNVRLGAWLGNTNDHGNATYTHPGPRYSIEPLFAEMFGLTNSESGYVNLSDGGHFDNLGLYEVVLRRCRYDGQLVYIKPTLRGRGAQVPYDIYSYSRESQAFPHEPTADQWFSESQFESYRALGAHIMDQLAHGLGTRTDALFTDLYSSVKGYLGELPPTPATAAAEHIRVGLSAQGLELTLASSSGDSACGALPRD
jgi:hypothetical protein